MVRLVSPDEQRRWADTLLSRTSDELRKRHPGLEITTSRLSGRPAASLSAEASKAEMLVIGSLRLTGVPGSLIGSVTMATISATERPVVLVRAATSTGNVAQQYRDGRPLVQQGAYLCVRVQFEKAGHVPWSV